MILVGRSEGSQPIGRPKQEWDDDNIKQNLEKVRWVVKTQIEITAQDVRTVSCGTFVLDVI